MYHVDMPASLDCHPGAILLFDPHHPSIPTRTRHAPARAAAVKGWPVFEPPRQRREASLTAASTTASSIESGL
jgi:hypothetical protein